MIRQDEGMPFLLCYENVAWMSDGVVSILDRRVYPHEIRHVTCTSHRQVARAITDMVTQSAGPYTAVAMGLALAAHECRNLAPAAQVEYLRVAARTLTESRPTASARYRLIADRCLKAAHHAIANDEDPVNAIQHVAIASLNHRYTTMQRVADHLLQLIPPGGAILTQCFGETVIGGLVRASHSTGKTFRAFCAETRPYLQGARLTASCFAEGGIETTVVTDNAVAHTLSKEGIDLLTSAADVITADGHIVNKIGTWQHAIVAKHVGVPFYVTGIPDSGQSNTHDVTIEMREPTEVLSWHGVRHTAPGVKGLYPAFDITPPDLLTGVVTDRGVFAPRELPNYLVGTTQDFY